MLADPITLDDVTNILSRFVSRYGWDGPKSPPSAPPAIPPIIINPFSYQRPAPAIDPLSTPPGPPIAPPPAPHQRMR